VKYHSLKLLIVKISVILLFLLVHPKEIFHIALKIGTPKRKLIFQPSFFMGYVKFRWKKPEDGQRLPSAETFGDLQRDCSLDEGT